jgi:hypothetical protein
MIKKPEAKIPFLRRKGQFWYWIPSPPLRAAFKTTSLGDNEDEARVKARILNREVDLWRKREKPSAAKTRAQPRTVGELIEAWRAAELPHRKATTQKSYTYELNRLHDEFGHEAASRLTAVRVDQWADTLRRTAPSTLRLVGGRGRQVFHWAARKGLVPAGHNPFASMDLPSGKKRAFRFEWRDIEHIMRIAQEMGRPSLGLALAIAFLTVQRITDVLRITHGMVERHGAEASLRFRQGKTGFMVDMPWPEHLDQWITKSAKPQECLILSEGTGKPYKPHDAAHVFARIIQKAVEHNPRQWAHLKGGQLRDGRRSGFVHGIMHGARVEDMVNLSGHSLDEGFAIIDHYLPKTRKGANKAATFMRVS